MSIVRLWIVSLLTTWIAFCAITFQPVCAADYRVNYTAELIQGTTAPLQFPSSGVTVLPSSNDFVATNVPIGFTFMFYGQDYTSCNLSTNGNIQFVTASTTSTPSALPDGLTSLQPLIAYFFCNLDSTNAAGSISYATLDVAPNRKFVVRLSTVPAFFYTATFTLDVVLYESSNVIEIRYYNIGYGAMPLLIGVSGSIHPDFSTDFTVYNNINAIPFTPALQQALNGNTLKFKPGPNVPYTSNVPDPSFTIQGTYSATFLTPASAYTLPPISGYTSLSANNDAVVSIALGWPFWFYGANFSTVVLNTNGILQFDSMSSMPYPQSLPTSDSTQVPFFAFAWANWDAAKSTQSIKYYVDSTLDNGFLRIRYESLSYITDSTATLSCDVVLYQNDSSIQVWYQTFPTTNGNVTIGMQSANMISLGVFDYVSLVNNEKMAASISAKLSGAVVRFAVANASIATNSMTRVPSVFKNSTMLSGVPARISFPNPIYIPVSDVTYDLIPIGFPFRFGSSVFSSTFLTHSGTLGFAVPLAIYSFFFTFPLTYFTPSLLFLYTEMTPTLETQRMYQSTGAYPNRLFQLRLDGVPYTSTLTNAVPTTVSLDVLLFEQDYRIEVRYYNIPPASSFMQFVSVGAQDSYIARSDGTVDFVSPIRLASLFYNPSLQLNGSTWSLYPANSTTLPNTESSYEQLQTSIFPRVDLPSPTVIPTSLLRSSFATVQFGFNFVFYGVSYSQAALSRHGYLQFNNNINPGAASSHGLPLGVLSLAPVLEFCHTNVDMSGASGNIANTKFQYASLGQVPYRYFVLQYISVPVMFASYIDLDLFLNETSNSVEVRFYRVTASLAATVTIGMLGSATARADGSYDFVQYMDMQALSDDTVRTLQSNAVVWVPRRTSSTLRPYSPSLQMAIQPLSSPSPPALTGATPLVFTSTDVQLVKFGFFFRFPGAGASWAYVSPLGYISFSTPASLTAPMALPTQSTDIVPIFAFFFTKLRVSSSSSWSYVTTGMYPSRVFTLRANNVPYNTSDNLAVTLDVQLFELDGRISVLYYDVSANQNQKVLIGAQGSVSQRDDGSYDYSPWMNNVPLYVSLAQGLTGHNLTFNPTVPLPLPPTIKPLPSTFTGTYNVSHTFSVVDPVLMDGATTLSSLGMFSMATVTLPFPFFFFNTMYTSVNVAPNGNIQFTTKFAFAGPSDVPASFSFAIPYIGFLFTTFYPTSTNIMVKSFGVWPDQYWVLRFNQVRYLSDPGSATLDVVLFQANYSIEVRYYAILPAEVFKTVIAVERAQDDYAVVLNNVAMNSTVAASLSFSTIRFQVVNLPSWALPSALSSSSSSTSSPSQSSSTSSSPSSPSSPTLSSSASPSSSPTLSSSASPSSSPTLFSSASPSSSSTVASSSASSTSLSSSSASSASSGDPLGCIIQTVPAGSSANRVTLILALTRTQLVNSYGNTFVSVVLGKIAEKVSVPRESLSCAGIESSATAQSALGMSNVASEPDYHPASLAAQQQSSSILYIAVIRLSSDPSSADVIAGKIAEALKNPNSVLNQDASFSAVAPARQQLPNPITPACASPSGQFTTNCESSSSSSSSGLSGGAIAGIVIGAVVAILLIAFGAIICLRRSKSKSHNSYHKDLPNEGVELAGSSA